MENDVIAGEELDAILSCIKRISETQHTAETTALIAENKMLEAKLAQVLYKNTALSLYVKYGLTKNDEIDDKTGQILKGVRSDDGKKESDEENPNKEG